jgi:tRNA threonylcarbamoyl adenosine modification protein YeaZ
MITLCCETSTLLGSVALLSDGKVLASEESQRQGSHSDMLNVLVEKVLQNSGKKLSDVDAFISGTGPGSFTGIRISLNAIKAFAYCHQKPVMGGNSLMSLAYGTRQASLPSEFLELPIISMINAYKNMCYVATYKFGKTGFSEVKSPEVIRVQKLADYVTETSLVCGDGFSTYQKYFPQDLIQKMRRHPEVSDDPQAKTLGQLAHAKLLNEIAWNELLPLYLRASEAEENLQGIKYQPLI